MEMKKIKITPFMAQQWLEVSNASNRTLSYGSVSKYAADMAGGNWKNTHQNAIAFYDDGQLADGQHRLSAIVQAGVAVEMFVASGLSRTDASAIDQGRARTVTDTLRISGLLSHDKYISASVAIAKMIFSMEVKSKHVPSVSEIAVVIEKLRPFIDRVTDATGSAQRGIGTAPVRAAIVTAWFNLPDEMVERLTRILVSGMPESQTDDTIIRLRNWLIQLKTSGNNERISAYLTTLRVFNAYADGESLGVIRRTEKLYYKTGVVDGK